MSVFPAGSGLMLGGSLLSSLGGMMGAGSQNRAGRQARDYYAGRTGEGANRLGSSFFGVQNFDDLIKGSTGDRGAMGSFVNSTGGSLLDQLRGIANYTYGQASALPVQYQAETAKLAGQGQGVLEQLMAMHKGGADASLGAYDQAAAGLMGGVQQWGKGREESIRRDAATSLKDANQSVLAQLAGTGFGNSTVAANAISGNARRSANDTQDRLQSLADSQIDRTTGLGRSLLSERFGATTDFINRSNDAAERVMGQNLANAYGRSEGLTNQRANATSQIVNASLLPVNTQLSVLSGGVMNPWLGQNTSQYYPGMSGSGSVLSSLGNLAAGLGSQQFNQQQTLQLLQQLMRNN